MRFIRRILGWAIGLVVILAAAAAAAYYAGVKLPVYHDTNPIAFQNWNKTSVVKASLLHDSRVWRRDGRTHLTVNLQMPDAVQRLQSFLDGGRTELVTCGPQKLFMHSLLDGRVGIEGDLLTITGTVDMELEGLLNLRDGWPLKTSIRFGHDRTAVWAQVVSLSIGQIPQEMLDAVLEKASRFAYTREQIFELIAKDLTQEDKDFLAKHREALDLAFEAVKPAQTDETVYLDAEISVDEGAVFGAVGDRLVQAPGISDLAELLGPNQAHAQFNLKDLTDKLEDAGKKLGKELLDGDASGDNPLRALEDALKGDNPLEALESVLSGLADCQTAF
ncbi:MAG: hypothetical protein AAF557_13245 [Pseudomonadota bacterium]